MVVARHLSTTLVRVWVDLWRWWWSILGLLTMLLTPMRHWLRVDNGSVRGHGLRLWLPARLVLTLAPLAFAARRWLRNIGSIHGWRCSTALSSVVGACMKRPFHGPTLFISLMWCSWWKAYGWSLRPSCGEILAIVQYHATKLIFQTTRLSVAAGHDVCGVDGSIRKSRS